jgi:uncharacterized tellurite resistance protein B-like protein
MSIVDHVKDIFQKFSPQQNSNLQKSASGETLGNDTLVALGVLFLEIAGKDDDYDPAETRMIFDIIESQFEISKKDTLNLLETAKELRSNPSALNDCFKIFQETYSDAQRERIFFLCWKIILADGKIDPFESKFISQVKNRLRISDEAAERARTTILG